MGNIIINARYDLWCSSSTFWAQNQAGQGDVMHMAIQKWGLIQVPTYDTPAMPLEN